MVEEIRKVLAEIEQLLCEADNTNDRQCNDMTLNHLIIAMEWQKRKMKKPFNPLCEPRLEVKLKPPDFSISPDINLNPDINPKIDPSIFEFLGQINGPSLTQLHRSR